MAHPATITDTPHLCAFPIGTRVRLDGQPGTVVGPAEDGHIPVVVSAPEPVLAPLADLALLALSSRDAADTSDDAEDDESSSSSGVQLSIPAGPDVRSALARLLDDYLPCLCSFAALAVQQQEWTCGYDNLHAVIKALGAAMRGAVPIDLGPASDHPGGLQRAVEAAWAEGFDPSGAAQYGRCGLIGTTGRAAWIGAAEQLVTLYHLRFKAFIIEVHGGAPTGAAVWTAVRSILSQSRQRRIPTVPILLQHEGHSRTILGVTTVCGKLSRTPSLVLRDPLDGPAIVRLVPPSALGTRSYSLIVALGLRLSDAAAASRRGKLRGVAARWADGVWEYDHEGFLGAEGFEMFS